MAMAIESLFAGASAGVDLPPGRLEFLRPPGVLPADASPSAEGGAGTFPIEIAACGSAESPAPEDTLATASATPAPPAVAAASLAPLGPLNTRLTFTDRSDSMITRA